MADLADQNPAGQESDWVPGWEQAEVAAQVQVAVWKPVGRTRQEDRVAQRLAAQEPAAVRAVGREAALESVARELAAGRAAAPELAALEPAAVQAAASESVARELAALQAVAPKSVALELAAARVAAPESAARELEALQAVAPESVARELAALRVAAPESVAREPAALQAVAPESVARELAAVQAAELVQQSEQEPFQGDLEPAPAECSAAAMSPEPLSRTRPLCRSLRKPIYKACCDCSYNSVKHSKQKLLSKIQKCGSSACPPCLPTRRSRYARR